MTRLKDAIDFTWALLQGKPTTVSGFGITDAVTTADARLTDARAPTAHASSHVSTGSDPLTLMQSQITGLPIALATKVPTSRTLTINGTAFDLSADRSWTISGTGGGDVYTNVNNQFTTRQDIGGSGSGWASGLYVSGDSSLPAIVGRGYGRSGAELYSDSNNGLYAQSNSGVGVRAISASTSAVWATTNNSASSAQALLLEITGSSTNDVANGFDLHHTTSATPIAGFGVQARFFLKSSTTQFRNAAVITALWNDPADATRKADLVFRASDFNSDREFLRGRGTGAAAAIGFLGATPIVQQSAAANATDLATAIALVNDLKAKLQAFGLLA